MMETTTAGTPTTALDSAQEEIYARTLASSQAEIDQLFQRFLPLQGAFVVLLALVVAPRTWTGSESAVHLHVWAGLGLGGLLTSYPLWLLHAAPGERHTRVVVAIAQMLVGALLVHLTGGRIETHFHFFASLVGIALYRDLVPLGAAVGTVVVDHLLRGLYWPQSVFGVATSSPFRTLEHGAWVVFEVFFLYLVVTRGLAELRQVARHQGELQDKLRVLGQRDAAYQQVIARTTHEAERMARAADQALETAREVGQRSRESLQASQQGQAENLRASEALQRLAENVQAMSETISGLVDQVETVTGIVKVVNDISEQSKFLALNASIEAARAGEHGRGFAVVATEVQSLARQSQEATGQIRTILESFRQAAQGAGRTAGEGRQEAGLGAEVSRSTAASLASMVRQLEDFQTSASRIEDFIQEQHVGVRRLASTVRELAPEDTGLR